MKPYWCPVATCRPLSRSLRRCGLVPSHDGAADAHTPTPARRTLPGGAAIAAAAPVLSAIPATAAVLAPATTLPVDLVNRPAGQQVYAHVVGLDRATGKWLFLASEAKTRVHPGSPTAVTTTAARHGIRLGAAGTARSITIPALDSGPPTSPSARR